MTWGRVLVVGPAGARRQAEVSDAIRTALR